MILILIQNLSFYNKNYYLKDFFIVKFYIKEKQKSMTILCHALLTNCLQVKSSLLIIIKILYCLTK